MSALLPLSELLPKTVDGLLVSPGLVPPVLDGRKTVTRRMSAAKWMRRKKGDLLFLRENWSLTGWDGMTVRLVYLPGALESWTAFVRCPPDAGDWFWRESERTKAWWAKHGRDSAPLRPSLLLPRWASRCVLRLTEDPRLERVQEITEEDAKREGVPLVPMCTIDTYPEWMRRVRAARPHRTAFQVTWEKLHTKDGERWEDNPLIVRLAFERAA